MVYKAASEVEKVPDLISRVAYEKKRGHNRVGDNHHEQDQL